MGVRCERFPWYIEYQSTLHSHSTCILWEDSASVYTKYNYIDGMFTL